MELKTPQNYIEAAKRRKWLIIIPFFLAVVLSYGVYKKLPKVYRATTLILVQPQEVPEDYVKPTVTSLISDRLSTLSQQILSRTQLEKVISEFGLYPDLLATGTMEGVVEVMRGAITIEVQRGRGRRDVQNTFTIAYESRDPTQVMMVTNRLASLFIEENLKARERQAVGTSDFIERELLVTEATLKEEEQMIRSFKERYMGELPEQLDANLRILERLQDQISNNNDSLQAAEERRIMLQGEIAQLSGHGITTAGGEVFVENPLAIQLTQLRGRLNELQSMYTDKHPDVVDAKAQIVSLEQQIAQQGDVSETANTQVSVSVTNPSAARLRRELADVKLEINRLKVERESLKEQIKVYQRRVENIPKREQELATLTRDYDLLKINYQSLLGKRIQAKMAENLERRQMGEQFKILDLARKPEKPVKPDRKKVMLIGAFLGLLLGGGLGYIKETQDKSFYKFEEVEEFLGFPVIASIPAIETSKARGD